MAKHPHAELMMQYAEDAMETDEPWLLWQYRCEGKWKQCLAHPSWAKVAHSVASRKESKSAIMSFHVQKSAR